MTFNEKIASPTVNPITVMTLLNLAAIDDRETFTADAPGAFLIPDKHPDDHAMYTYIDGDLLEELLEVFPTYSTKISGNRLYFELKKYMYGTPQASMKFYQFMSRILTDEMGFKACKSDKCLFTRSSTPGNKTFLSIHVDDILGIVDNKDDLKMIKNQLVKRLKVTWHDGDLLDYVGLTVSRNRTIREIKISMQGLIDKAVAKYGSPTLKTHRYPSKFNDDVFLLHTESAPVDRVKYLGLLMTLMYPARFVRPDYIVITSVLATRSQHPVDEDWDRLIHLLGYLKGCSNLGIVFRNPDAMSDRSNHPWRSKELRLSVDCSHGKHIDGKGHCCIMATFGTGPVMIKCYKIKHVTLSSTETEISGCSEAATYVIWFRMLLEEWQEPPKYPTIIYEDNSASICMRKQRWNVQTFRAYAHQERIHK